MDGTLSFNKYRWGVVGALRGGGDTQTIPAVKDFV